MKRSPTSAAETIRWAVAWTLYGAGKAVDWFNMRTTIGCLIWRWTQWPIHRLEEALTDGSGWVQGNGPGPWRWRYQPPFRADLDDEIPF